MNYPNGVSYPLRNMLGVQNYIEIFKGVGSKCTCVHVYSVAYWLNTQILTQALAEPPPYPIRQVHSKAGARPFCNSVVEYSYVTQKR